MNSYTSRTIINLSDLSDEPVRKTIGSLNYFASSYGLEPFKLVCIKNPVLLSRFKIKDAGLHPLDENCFLSVLQVKTSISLEEVNNFIIDLAAPKQLSHSALDIYKNVLQQLSKNKYRSGREWAFSQAHLGLRLLLSLAKDAGIDVAAIDHVDNRIFNNVLELDENKWTIYSALLLRVKIKGTPRTLLNSSFGLN